MDRSRVAIVIPAFNESGTVGDVVQRVGAWGRVVVVDDGSSDDTSTRASAAGAEVVRHDRNLGYDAALNSGFARAAQLGCEYVVTCDADGQHNAEQIGQFVDLLDAGYELVLGVRDRFQRVSEKAFAWVGLRLWGMRDPLCGMKAYRIGLYEKRGRFDTFGSIGTELAVRSVAAGARSIEQPTKIRDRHDAPRFAHTLVANLKIFRALYVLVSLHALGRLAH